MSVIEKLERKVVGLNLMISSNMLRTEPSKIYVMSQENSSIEMRFFRAKGDKKTRSGLLDPFQGLRRLKISLSFPKVSIFVSSVRERYIKLDNFVAVR